MKKHIAILIIAAILALTATSCNDNKDDTGTDAADTTTISPETTMPAATPATGSTDTSVTAPVDPAMDTSASQTPKM